MADNKDIYSRRNSRDLAARKRRHRRRMDKLAREKQKRLNDNPGKVSFFSRKGAKSYVTTRVLMVLAWIINISKNYYESYTFADAWHDVIVPVWLAFTVLWVAWMVLSSVFNSAAGRIHIHTD